MLGIGIRLGSGAPARETSPPVISIASGTGYAGSVYGSTVGGQWYADDVAISGETGSTLTMTAALEGKAIRCGASNVIQMWTPAALDGALRSNGGWWMAEDQTVAAGRVTTWADRFGVRDMTQTTATAQPEVGTINGLDCANFGGTTFSASSQGLVVDTAFTPGWWILLGQWIAGTEATFPTYNSLVAISSSSVNLRIAGDSGTANLLSGSTVSNFSTARRNGASEAVTLLPLPLGTISAYPNSASLNVAGKGGIGLTNNAASGRSWRGPMLGAVALGSVPDTATRQQIEGYLHHKAAISASLPADHPYRNSAPRIA